MTVSLVNFDGCGMGDLSRCTRTNGSPTAVTTPTPQYDDYCYELDINDFVVFDMSAVGTPVGWKVSFWIRFEGTSTSTTKAFIVGNSGDIITDDGSIGFRTVSDTLTLVDETGSDIHTGPSISADTWYFVELYFVESATGAYGFRVNGGTEYTGTGDFSTGTTPDEVRFRGRGLNHHVNSFAAWEAESGDTLDFTTGIDGECGVKTYQPGTGSTQNTVFGGGIDQGSVADLDDRPWTVEATPVGITIAGQANEGWDCDATSGNQYNGPSGDSDIGTIEAAMSMMWAKRGNGSGTTHYIMVGRSGAAMSVYAKTLTTAYALFTQINTAGETPSTSQYSAVGLQKDSGGREILVGDLGCSILFAAPAAAAAPFLPYHARQPDVRRLM
ncbi:MAG: hypothetical protein OES09_00145 [Gammaproteobacteria bacterium]|nr:hypothetical protein [Gammaproteobacteria bacterium]